MFFLLIDDLLVVVEVVFVSSIHGLQFGGQELYLLIASRQFNLVGVLNQPLQTLLLQNIFFKDQPVFSFSANLRSSSCFFFISSNSYFVLTIDSITNLI